MSALVLRIEEARGGSYPVKLIDPGATGKEAVLAESLLPVALPEGKGSVAAFDATRAREVLRKGTEANKRAVGTYLYKLLFQGDVEREWRAARPNRVTVLDIAPLALKVLPWELLYGPDHSFLALDESQPVHRSFGKPVTEPIDERLPLRVLVVVGASEADDKEIFWQAEVRALRRLLRDPARFDIEELICPTRSELEEINAGFRPHVFHFIGHGHIHEDEAALRIWRKAAGAYDEWTNTQVLQDLDGWPPPLAFVNACRSGELQAAQDSLSVAETFATLGARSIITMQSDIRGDSATAFATELYGRVAGGMPIDQAVASARRRVNRDLGADSDWAVPVLQMRCAPGHALPTMACLNRDAASTVVEAFSDVAQFVDRTPQRRGLCREAIGADRALPDRSVFVVHGAHGLGKTFLLKWCARHFALRDRNVRYINLADGTTKNFRSLLELVRRGDGRDSPLTGGLDAQAFIAFDQRLAQVTPTESPKEDVIDELSVLFRSGLAQAAAARPLVLCLDHVEWRSDAQATVVGGDFRLFVEHVLEPIEKGGVKDVKVLLGITDATLDAPELKWFRSKAVPVPLPPWEIEHFEFLARAALDDLLGDDEAAVATLLQASRSRLPPTPWAPSVLARVRAMIEKFNGI